MRIVRPVLFLVILLTLLPIPARAGLFVETTDPNDVPGKLDLSFVRGFRNASGQPITFTIRMQAPFERADLAAGNWVKVFLNVDGDANADYVGTVKKSGDHLAVYFSGQGSNFEGILVHRPNLRTLRFTVPGGAPLAPNGPVSMIVESHFVNGTTCILGCLDVAPNSFAWISL